MLTSYKNDFPIFAHHPDLIYLDSAASAQKPQQVIDAMSRFYTSDYANINRGLYELSSNASEMFEDSRKAVAQFIKAKSAKQIVFTKNSTEGVNLARYSWVAKHLKPGDTILTTILEHHSNFVGWQTLAKELNLNFKVIKLNDDGNLTADEIIQEIDQDKTIKFVAISSCSNVLGIKIDANRVVTHARNKNITTFVDACQSAPHSPLDATEIDADFLVFSGHKLYGPLGVGILVLSEKMCSELSPFLYGGDMIKSVSIENTTFADSPNRFEAGTPNIAGVIGLKSAIDYLNEIGMDKVEMYSTDLTNYTLNKLLELEEHYQILGPKQNGLRNSLISFYSKKIHAHDIAQVLSDNNICVRAGHHCAQPLFAEMQISSAVRISLGLYNNKADIDKTIEVLKEIPQIFS